MKTAFVCEWTLHLSKKCLLLVTNERVTERSFKSE